MRENTNQNNPEHGHFSRKEVKKIHDQQRPFDAEHSPAFVKNMIAHFDTNYIPRYNPGDISRKICRLLLHIRHLIPNTLFRVIPTKASIIN